VIECLANAQDMARCQAMERGKAGKYVRERVAIAPAAEMCGAIAFVAV
jgi:hypothetical protein